jgi:cytochrome c553
MGPPLCRLSVVLTCLTALPSFAADPPKAVDFAHDVVPILKAHCAKCHTNGTYKGSMSMDSRADVLKKAAIPHKAAESEMIRRVTSADPDERMPPDGPRLTDKQVRTLRAWIDEGVPWESGFSFKVRAYVAPLKPRRPNIPAGSAHPIDRLLGAYFSQQKVTAPPPLDDAAFARRAYLDLIGLLPAPSELDAFLSDSAKDKRAVLLRRLLNDKRAYADHWLTFWNDLLRNEYKGTGYIDGGRKQITVWLYKALLDNKPYDQFARELINPTSESEGFAKGIRWRGEVNASQVVELQFAQNVGQVFFGANLKCASCHDSFIDHWKLDDAYGMAAVIADKPLATHRCDKPTGKTAGPKFLFPELGSIDPNQPKAKRLERLAELTTHSDNGRFARTIVNRLWHRLLGRGIVHPVDQMGDKPWSEDLLDYLAAYLVDSNYDLKKLLEHITTSAIYQAQAVPVPKEVPADEYVFRGPEVKRLTAEQFVDAVWILTGTAPAKPVAQAPLPPFPDSTPKERRFVRATLVDADLLMRSLGRPNREQVVTTRPDQLSTLQALDLANGRILAELLARGAANVLKADSKATADEIANRVFVLALSRKPTADELVAAQAMVGDQPTAEGVADLLWAVVMLPEFQLVR